MAHTAPILLAFILNCCEIFVFRNVYTVLCAPARVSIARTIFCVGNYFLLLDIKLYPDTFRKTHWIPRSFIEFLLAVYLFETFLCDFWYPLEYFSHKIVNNTAYIIKKKHPKTGVLCYVACYSLKVLTNKKFPMAISIGLSLLLTLIIIHGTKAIDFTILSRCGPKCFLEHLQQRVIKSGKKFACSILGIQKSANETCHCVPHSIVHPVPSARYCGSRK